MIGRNTQIADIEPCTSFNYFKKIALFANLPVEEVECFMQAAQTRHYYKGQMVYLEGEKAEYYYIVCRGWLKLFHSTEDGKKVIFAMLTRGSLLGESAIFEQGRYAHNAQAVEDTQLLRMPLQLLEQQLKTSNIVSFNMMTYMTRYQRYHGLRLEQYRFYSAPQRIGLFVLGLCPEQKDGIVLNLPYDKMLIASTLGMKGETFSRALNILRKETGIDIAGTRVTIDSIECLLKFINGSYPFPYVHHAMPEQPG